MRTLNTKTVLALGIAVGALGGILAGHAQPTSEPKEAPPVQTASRPKPLELPRAERPATDLDAEIDQIRDEIRRAEARKSR